MPVSRIALVVRDVGRSAAFYTAALQPLEYRYFGTLDGQVGLGVREADLFLSPAKDGSKLGPIHVAFSAERTSAVRSFYANALAAGGRPTGAPGYRGCDKEIFNAAVLDLDGNTVEVIFRDVSNVKPAAVEGSSFAPSMPIVRAAPRDRRATKPRSSSTTNRPDSNGRASYATNAYHDEPSPKTTSFMAPHSRADDQEHSVENANKTDSSFVGALLGAAVGAAAIYNALAGATDSNGPSDGKRSSRSSKSSSRSSKHSYHPRDSSGKHDLPSLDTTAGRRQSCQASYGLSSARESGTEKPWTPIPVRRDSGVSISSKRSKTARRHSSKNSVGTVWRDVFQTSEALSAPRYKTTMQASSPRSLPRRSQSFATEGHYVPSTYRRPREDDDRRREQFASQGRRHTAPAPVPLDVIKRHAGGHREQRSRKDDDCDTVLPEDSISYISSRRHNIRKNDSRSSGAEIKPRRGMSMEESCVRRGEDRKSGRGESHRH